MKKHVLCKECQATFKDTANVGAIYIEDANGLNVNYLICKDCLNIEKHQHKLNLRSGWSHLYGDISGGDREWMCNITSKTRDTICGQAGYHYLNEHNRG